MSKVIHKINISDKYKNPENKDVIFKKILESKTCGDLYELIKQVYPDWICGNIKSYSKDYPHLQQNWEYVCNKINTKHTEILVVNYIGKGDDYTLLNTFCELMTTAGFCVRRKEELIGCYVCGLAIPVLELWKEFHTKGLPVPSQWSKQCSNCKRC